MEGSAGRGLNVWPPNKNKQIQYHDKCSSIVRSEISTHARGVAREMGFFGHNANREKGDGENASKGGRAVGKHWGGEGKRGGTVHPPNSHSFSSLVTKQFRMRE